MCVELLDKCPYCGSGVKHRVYDSQAEESRRKYFCGIESVCFSNRDKPATLYDSELKCSGNKKSNTILLVLMEPI